MPRFRLLTHQRQRKHNARLEDENGYNKFWRDTNSYDAHTWLMSTQPLPAIIAILGCLFTFAFCSATWWYTEPSFGKVAIAYAAQFIVLLIFVVLKAIRLLRSLEQSHNWFRRRPTDFDFFAGKLDALTLLVKSKDKKKEASSSGILLETYPSNNQAVSGEGRNA